MRRSLVAGLVWSLLTFPAAAQAQGFGIAPRIGTLGIGADIGFSPTSRVAVRAGAGFFPFDITLTADDIEYSLQPPKAQFSGLVDLFLVGGLRLTGGAVFARSDIEATGTIVAGTMVTIGDIDYSASDVGTLSMGVGTNPVAPYVGIGFGNVGKRGIRFFADLGVAFQGAPEVSLAVSGPLKNNALFQAELAKEEAAVEEDISWAKYYPVLSLGIAIGF